MKSIQILFWSLFTLTFASDVNELPMYGRVKKSPEQIEFDKRLISESIKTAGSRKAASVYASKRGWEFLQNGDTKTSMKRLNQAWLLDSTNAEAYWGFAVLVGQTGDLNRSIDFMKTAYKYDSTNGRLVADLAYTLARLGKKESNSLFLKEAEKYYIKSTQLSPDYGYQFVQWAILKFYLNEYKAAWDKILIAESLGVEDIDKNFLAKLSNKLKRPKK